MTIGTTPPSLTHARPQPTPAPGWNRAHRVLGWLLLGAWVVLMASTLLLGTRESTYAELEARIAAGEVDVVEVAGEHLGPDSVGYSRVVVRWRDDLVLHEAWVTEASSDRRSRREARDAGARSVVVGRVDERLPALDPGLRLTRGELPRSSFTLAGLAAPGWVGIGWIAVVIGCLGLVGPWSWRATGWAWAWLVLLLPPYGVLAFLVLGGPTGLFPPRAGHRQWLTGGWAFLLALVLGGAANAS